MRRHNQQLCSYRPVTEAGPGRPRELPGCISVLLCQRVRSSAKSQENQRFGAGGTMRFRMRSAPRASGEAASPSRRCSIPSACGGGRQRVHRSIGRVQGAGVHLAACVSQQASVRASAGAEVHRNGDAARVECVNTSEGRTTAPCASTETGYPHQLDGFGRQWVAAVSLPCVAQRCARRQNAAQLSAPALCVQWRRVWHNTQLCSYRLVTEAGLARPRELPAA